MWIEDALKFVQVVGVPNAMALYLIWYYGKKLDKITNLLTALMAHQGIYPSKEA